MKARTFTVACFLFITFLLTGQAIMAQDSLNVTLDGHRWAYGPVKATVMSGDSILCVAYGGYLQLYDVTTPASPVEAGKLALPRPLHSMVNYSTGSAGYIIGADGWGVQIIDVTDPDAPALEKPVETDGYSFDVDTLDSYCMVADGTNGLVVIDLSDPTNASLTAGHLVSSKITRSVSVYRDTIYAACIDPDFMGTNNRIQIATHAPLTANPLKQIGFFTGVNFPLDIAAGATTFDGSPATGLFIADSTRLVVLDVADLSGVKGSKTVHGIADVIAMNGTDIYVGTRNADYNLKMFDVSAPAAIPDPDSVSHSGILKHITFFDDGANGHLYLSLQYGGALYCADDLTGDAYFVDKEDAGHLQAVAVAGNFAFVADSSDGVRRLDISDQSNIFQTHVTNTVHYNDCQAYDLKVSGDTLYVASGKEGLKLFDVSDLSFIDEISTNGKARAVDVLEGLAYIADGNEGLYIVEIANPLTEKGSWSLEDASHKAVDVKVWRNQILSKTYAFIAVEFTGLWIIDVSNPASPVKVSSLTLTGRITALDVDVLGHYAYVASGTEGFHVIDIRNLSNPQRASTMGTRSAAEDIEVRSSYAYVADGAGGLSVFLIDDKNNPVEIGYYDTGCLANGISVLDDENIFLTDGDDGLYIFDNVLGHLNYFNETYDDLTGDDDYILPSGRSVPVVVQSAKIVRYNAAGQAVINDLAAGDEFAIFDNQGGPNEMKMVGRKKYHGIYPFTITVWMQYHESATGTTVPGAIQGHPMIFKIWDASENRELGAYPVFTYGSGEFDETAMMTIVNPLTAVNLEFFDVTMPTGDFITVHISNDIKYNNNPIETGDEIVILDYEQNRVVGGAVYEGTSFSVPVWMERDNGLPGARPANRLAFKAYLRTYGKMFVAIPTYAGGASEANFTDDVWVSSLRMYETDKTQQISLEEDKINLISFYVNPEINGQPDISKMLIDVVYQNTALCQDDRGNTYIIGSGINEIGPVDFKKGYQVYFDDEGTPATSQVIGIEGYGVNATDYTHSLQDLQMIGYPYEKRYWAQDVFSAIVSAQSLFVIQGDSEGEVWIKDTANGININYFDSYGGTGLAPGNGYLVYVNTPMSYTYPAAAGMTGSMGKVGPAKTQTPVRLLSSHFSYTETGLQYPVLITASQTDMNSGDEVALFDGDICVGAGVFQGAFPLLVSAWKGVETEKISLPGYQDGHEIGIRIWDSLQGEEKIVEVLGEGSEQPKFGEGLYAACRIGQIRTHIDDAELPEEFRLDRNYPNPFNPDTWIQYQLPEQTEVSLVIYNSKGQRVRVLVDEIKNAGRHRVKWDARDSRGRRVTSGVYIMKINAGKYRGTQKMLLIQ